MNAIRPEMTTHPLAQAAREVNAYSERSGLKETCEHYGLAMDDVRYIAEQRALRCVWAYRGINLNLKDPAILTLRQSEMPMYIQLTAAYMDGLMIGWRGKEFEAQP